MMGTMASRASNSTTTAASGGSPARQPPTNNRATTTTTTTTTTSSPNKTVFKCRKCNLTFDSADAASSHEEAEHAHLCGICKALRFRTMEELANHRRNCGEIVILDSGDSDRDDTESSADGVLPDEPVVSAGEINAGNSGTSSTIANNKGATNGENPSEWLTVWTCDICKTAQFESYDAAAAHEAICAGGGGSGSGVVQQDPLIQPQAQAVEAKTLPLLNSEPPVSSSSLPLVRNEKILFSPILSGSSDSLQYHQLSEYHRLVLGSIQLRHHPPTYTIKDSIEIGSLHCQYCSQELFRPNHDGSGIPRRWSIGSIGAELPGIVFAHLSVVCESPEGQERQHLFLKAKQSLQSGGHGTTFVNFLSSFFAENGITLPDRGGIGVLHDDDFMRHPQANKSKRGRQLLQNGSTNPTNPRPEKRSKQPVHDSRHQIMSSSRSNNLPVAKTEAGIKPAESTPKKALSSVLQFPRSKHSEIKYGKMGCKMHNEHERMFCVAPLDGIPFLSSFSKEEKKKLHASEILFLQQLELFTITPALMKSTNMNAPPQSVGIRCRNCIADQNGCCFMKLSSVNKLPHNLLLMAKEHVMSCQFLRPKDLKALELQDGNLGRLTTYCKWLARLYSLEDSANGGFDTGVIWGKSPKLPEVYCYPADIDVSFCVGN